jgi:hypothetical protein
VLTPLEQERHDLTKDIEFRESAINKYKDKTAKLKETLLPKVNLIA